MSMKTSLFYSYLLVEVVDIMCYYRGDGSRERNCSAGWFNGLDDQRSGNLWQRNMRSVMPVLLEAEC